MVDFFKRNGFVFLIALPYFFCINHYEGIHRDGILYTLQVIYRWFPERFLGDPQFMYGNQDSFTIFSPLYGVVMRCIPVDVAAILVTFFIQLFFAVAMIWIIRNFAKMFKFEGWVLPLSLVFFMLYAPKSEKTVIFFSRLIEPYPVPRTIAIVFAILGLAALFHKNKWITFVLALVGSLIHPLMAGWLFPIWLFYHYPKTKLCVIMASILFPFSGYIGVEPFASYPEGWYYKNLTYGPTVEYVLRFLMYIVFYVVFVKRFCVNKKIKDCCVSVLIVTSIAFYWFLWTGVNHFILLYQFQVWRMEWMCIVSSFLLFVIMLRDVFVRYKNNQLLTTWDIAVFFIGISLFSDAHYIEGILIGTILLFIPSRKIDGYIAFVFLLFYPVLNFIVASYLYVVMLGISVPLFFDYYQIENFYCHCTIVTALISLALGIYSVLKKNYLRALLFFTFSFFPRFMLLPIAAIVLPCLKKWQIYLVVLLSVIDGIWGFSLRNTSIPLTPLERNNFLCGLTFCILYFLFYKKRCKIIVILISICVALPYAAINWDSRTDDQKKEERNLNQFKEHVPFTQVEVRGKMLYYVNGFMNANSRLQFLGGNYIDSKSTRGEVFNKKHYKEATARLNKLIYKNCGENKFTGFHMRDKIIIEFYRDSLSRIPILVDRTVFLCSLGEITHLVSDFSEMPFKKQDSLHMDVLNKEIFLYQCPN